MSRPTQGTARLVMCTYTGLSPSMVPLSRGFYLNNYITLQPYNPAQSENCTVWAISRSLAATNGISSISFPSPT